MERTPSCPHPSEPSTDDHLETLLRELCHSGRNILQRGIGALELLKMKTASFPDAARLINEAQKAQEDLFRQQECLRLILRPPDLNCEPLDLVALIRQAFTDARQLSGRPSAQLEGPIGDRRAQEVRPSEGLLSRQHRGPIPPVSADLRLTKFALTELWRSLLLVAQESAAFGFQICLEPQGAGQSRGAAESVRLRWCLQVTRTEVPDGVIERWFEPMANLGLGSPNLGLAAANQVAKLHGGSLTACRLPAGQISPPELGPPKLGPPELGPPKQGQPVGLQLIGCWSGIP